MHEDIVFVGLIWRIACHLVAYIFEEGKNIDIHFSFLAFFPYCP